MFADMAAQLLDPCAQERDKRLDELAERLDAVGRLDSSTGVVDLDEDALRAVVWEYAPNDVESNVKEFTSLAKDGFATLGDNAVLPFRLLADPLRASEYLAPEVLEALGVESGADPDRLAADLQARYPSAPETVLDRSNLTALIQVAEGLAAARSLEIAWSERVRADRSSLEQLASTPSVEEVLACIKTAQFSTHWWGWSVCVSRDCGNMLAAALPTPNLRTLVAAVKAWIASGVSAAIKAAGGPLGIALAAYSIYLAVSIRANMTFKGVCIRGHWPMIWGMAVWAKGR